MSWLSNFRQVCCLFAALVFLCSFVAAQQDKGDKEVGLSGAATTSNSSPVTGSLFTEISLGKYFQKNQYVGIFAAPQFTFGGGNTSGGASLGGEFRYLFGHMNSRLWPFVGMQGGDSLMKSGGSWENVGVLAPEVGLKLYASRKTAFEVSYLLSVQFGSGLSNASFGRRSQNLIVFGFKHIF